MFDNNFNIRRQLEQFEYELNRTLNFNTLANPHMSYQVDKYVI